jgi:hypothetical protein
MSAKVWVTQETDHDFVPAQAWGEVMFMTRGELSIQKNSLKNSAMVDEIHHAIKKYDPDEDYIVITGSPYVAAMAFHALGLRGVRQLRMLRWSNRDFLYAPIIVDTGGMNNGRSGLERRAGDGTERPSGADAEGEGSLQGPESARDGNRDESLPHSEGRGGGGTERA